MKLAILSVFLAHTSAQQLCAAAFSRAEDARYRAVKSGASEDVAQQMYNRQLEKEKAAARQGKLDCALEGQGAAKQVDYEELEKDFQENFDKQTDSWKNDVTKELDKAEKQVDELSDDWKKQQEQWDKDFEKSQQEWNSATQQWNKDIDNAGKDFQQQWNDLTNFDSQFYNNSGQNSAQQAYESALKREKAMKEYMPHETFEELAEFYEDGKDLIPCASGYCPNAFGEKLECGRITLLAKGSSLSATFDDICLNPHTCGHEEAFENGKMELTCNSFSDATKMFAATMAVAASIALIN